MFWHHAIAGAALVGIVSAQTFTKCDPTKESCPPNPAFGTAQQFNMTVSPSFDLWEQIDGNIKYDINNGAALNLIKQGDSPKLRSKFYFFFGRTEVIMKAAPGNGIVSAIMLQSDDKDEIDWEMLGPYPNQATTNYFSRGIENFKNGGIYNFTSGTTQDAYRNYTTVWTKEKLEWFIDGVNIRTLNAKDANNTVNYPQTPMLISIGVWAAGDPRMPKGTREWAGGDTDYSKGPYTMHVKSVFVEDFTKGSKEYVWGDKSGSMQSIKVVEGNSTAVEAIKNSGPGGPSGWEALSPGAKMGIYGAAGGVGALALGTLIWYYIRQRRIGAAEAKKAEEDAAREREEMAQFERRGVNPDSFTEHGQEYGPPGTSGGESFDTVAQEKQDAWAAHNAKMAGVGAGAAVGAAALNASPRSPPRGSPPRAQGRQTENVSPVQQFDFGVPPPPAAATAGANNNRNGPSSPAPSSPGQMRPQGPPMAQGGYPRGPMRSATTDGGYGRPAPQGPQQGYGQQRMQSPGPMSPPQRSASAQPMYSPSPVRPDVAYNIQRMASPGAMRPDQQYGVQRMQSPGPRGAPGANYAGGQEQPPQQQNRYQGNGY
ncbi:hypothetical protein VHEMI06660 [[Torrubiella] hemipterigena]|uniref:chitinase n=1 Tax=[Torrubiella] hemipterigena TaxID=1531966 RepID=A0A0A1TLH2_9HYPO|nr:hypothetical protein VHEMI06660 [[Torrubiella] hemipterigena]